MNLPPRHSLSAGIAAAIVASLCCVGPLVLLTLGVGGVWIGSLTRLEPVRPFFIGATIIFLGLAFRRLYLQPATCAPGTRCADDGTLKTQRRVFWAVSFSLAALIAVPWFAPLFY